MFKERGRIHLIGEIVNTEKSFYREVVLDTTRHDPWTGEAQYSSFIKVIARRDRCSLFDSFKPGDVVEVEGFISGGVFIPEDTKKENYYNHLVVKSVTRIK